MIPKLDYGHPDRFVVYVNLTWPYANGVLDDAGVQTLFTKACSVAAKTANWAARPLGQLRLTTIDPSTAGFFGPHLGLRPGECLEVRFVPSLAPLGGTGTGLTLGGYENVMSLYDPLVSYVAMPARLPASMLPFIGVTVVHETLHALLPRTGRYGDQHQHSPIPDNVLFGPPHGTQIVDDPNVTDVQREALAWNFDRCRAGGLRANPQGPGFPDVKVADGGRPAWPIPAT